MTGSRRLRPRERVVATVDASQIPSITIFGSTRPFFRVFTICHTLGSLTLILVWLSVTNLGAYLISLQYDLLLHDTLSRIPPTLVLNFPRNSNAATIIQTCLDRNNRKTMPAHDGVDGLAQTLSNTHIYLMIQPKGELLEYLLIID